MAAAEATGALGEVLWRVAQLITTSPPFDKLRLLTGAALRRMAAATPVPDPALWTAAVNGLPEEVRQLLAGGADIEEPAGSMGFTPLGVVAVMGFQEVVLLLLANGAEVSATDNVGWTPLHYAALGGNVALVELLLDSGADVLSKSDSGKTPEDLATMGSHPQVAAVLKAEAERRAKCEAFAMGQQERLGAGSRVQELEVGVVRMVLDQV
ncbi:ankyrin repeat-containing domain protein [Baffinella frigidus]|nr:ankyrin repeat-containing domain protein [Cryptophyta sp. CCMP2293]